MNTMCMVEKVVSGGQTGADRAGLDAAMSLGLAVGGWCPEGRPAEDGVVPEKYPLRELQGAGYRKRTERNVIDSDGTLVLNFGRLSGGTKLTVDFAGRHKKPCLVVQLDGGAVMSDAVAVREWLLANAIKVLNVAGPRESKCTGIQEVGAFFVRQVLAS